jgi:hypothetical protein
LAALNLFKDKLSKNMGQVRRAFRILIDESKDIRSRLDAVLSGDAKVEGIGTLAIATEIDVYCKLDNSAAVSYLWKIFADYSAEAKEMARYRYEKLLAV